MATRGVTPLFTSYLRRGYSAVVVIQFYDVARCLEIFGNTPVRSPSRRETRSWSGKLTRSRTFDYARRSVALFFVEEKRKKKKKKEEEEEKEKRRARDRARRAR